MRASSKSSIIYYFFKYYFLKKMNRRSVKDKARSLLSREKGILEENEENEMD
jgi:hypothetical protein